VAFAGFDNTINSEQWTGNPQTSMSLDQAQEWKLFADDSFNHPYHQHINPFQLVSFGPPDDPNDSLQKQLEMSGMLPGMWRDTIPVFDSETVVRFTPRYFTGRMVYHCHTASHADEGMLAVADITGTSSLVANSGVGEGDVAWDDQLCNSSPGNTGAVSPSRRASRVSGFQVLLTSLVALAVAIRV